MSLAREVIEALIAEKKIVETQLLSSPRPSAFYGDSASFDIEGRATNLKGEKDCTAQKTRRVVVMKAVAGKERHRSMDFGIIWSISRFFKGADLGLPLCFGVSR